MPHVQWAGGVGRDELHIDPLPVPKIGAPIAVGGPDDRGERGGELIFGQPEIDKAGTGDLDFGDDVFGKGERRDDFLRHAPRIDPAALGQHHGEIGGEVAVAGVAGPLQHEGHLRVAEGLGHPNELGADRLVHGLDFFRADFEADWGFSGLSGFSLFSDLSDFSVFSDLSDFSALSAGSTFGPDWSAEAAVAGAAASVSFSLRGPFPSLP